MHIESQRIELFFSFIFLCWLLYIEVRGGGGGGGNHYKPRYLDFSILSDAHGPTRTKQLIILVVNSHQDVEQREKHRPAVCGPSR